MEPTETHGGAACAAGCGTWTYGGFRLADGRDLPCCWADECVAALKEEVTTARLVDPAAANQAFAELAAEGATLIAAKAEGSSPQFRHLGRYSLRSEGPNLQELADHSRAQATIDRGQAARLRKLAPQFLARDGAAAVAGAAALEYRADVYERRARAFEKKLRASTKTK